MVHFSGPGGAVGSVSVCVYVWTITFELNDVWTRQLTCWCTLTLSEFEVVGQSSWSRVKSFIFGCGCTLRRDIFWIVCRVLCAKVVVATFTEGSLVEVWNWTMSVGVSRKHGMECPDQLQACLRNACRKPLVICLSKLRTCCTSWLPLLTRTSSWRTECR